MPATPAKSVANQATSDVDMSGPKEQRSDLERERHRRARDAGPSHGRGDYVHRRRATARACERGGGDVEVLDVALQNRRPARSKMICTIAHR